MSFAQSGNPLGKRILPWKNPIQYPSRSMGAAQMRVSGSAGVNVPNGSTTNTSDFQEAVRFNVMFPSVDVLIHLFGSVTLKHSVTAGEFSMNVSMYPRNTDGSYGAGTTFINQPNIVLPIADKYSLIPIAQEYLNNHPDLSGPFFTAQVVLIILFFKNLTAGTLTWAQSNTTNTLAFQAIGAVYATP